MCAEVCQGGRGACTLKGVYPRRLLLEARLEHFAFDFAVEDAALAARGRGVHEEDVRRLGGDGERR